MVYNTYLINLEGRKTMALFSNNVCANCGKHVGLLDGIKVYKKLDGTVLYYLCQDCNAELLKRIPYYPLTIQEMKDIMADREHYKKCNLCGKTFRYSDKDVRKNKELESLVNTSKVWSDINHTFGYELVARSEEQVSEMKKNRLIDFDRCPRCNSKDLSTITVEEFKKSFEQNSDTRKEFSSADEIKKFKELLDMGIISQEEFDAKKKQLLGL
jgi:Zn-finger nucleic acid-binding protein